MDEKSRRWPSQPHPITQASPVMILTPRESIEYGRCSNTCFLPAKLVLYGQLQLQLLMALSKVRSTNSLTRVH
ncbi:hypothetical protein Mp_2g11730 [Marchantia polymorpha subsp. ruderalis]|uniref:Uncharacterized protein n=1 Tax=Marchantia polymorpha TaxID=3197 RepID=A0A2R6XCJ6_MARPO|nr:hypothetical protein MARPO_0023s0139 [Marchantia polymorpha]BBN01978.1 hypothetical protein Mp_2g11730 [Marchantia polymorpha subsp. ruderalis]|eukprot:PTQ43840.1 hypothetical protein MARPO_0023s0139 [Marchantia polymorpha]